LRVDDAYVVPTFDSNGQMTFDQVDTYTGDTRRQLSVILQRLKILTPTRHKGPTGRRGAPFEIDARNNALQGVRWSL